MHKQTPKPSIQLKRHAQTITNVCARCCLSYWLRFY